MADVELVALPRELLSDFEAWLRRYGYVVEPEDSHGVHPVVRVNPWVSRVRP